MTEDKANQIILLLTQLIDLIHSGDFPSFLFAVAAFLAFAHGFRAGAGGGSREI